MVETVDGVWCEESVVCDGVAMGRDGEGVKGGGEGSQSIELVECGDVGAVQRESLGERGF